MYSVQVRNDGYSREISAECQLLPVQFNRIYSLALLKFTMNNKYKTGQHINILSYRMEVNMKRKNINKEMLFSVGLALVLLFALGAGIYSVINTAGSKQGENNIVDLNEIRGDAALNDETQQEMQELLMPENIVGMETQSENETEADYSVDGWQETQDFKTANADEETVLPDTVDVGANAKVDPLTAYSFNETSVLAWPVKGDIILKYSMDSTILFKSLGVYKCNPAISIAADEGTNVGVAADGIVKSVENSEETGITVCIEIGGGYETTYGLLEDVVVKTGDTVTAGQLLGTVSAPTAYYSEEGSNLYFKLTKDGAAVDPSDYFEE